MKTRLIRVESGVRATESEENIADRRKHVFIKQVSKKQNLYTKKLLVLSLELSCTIQKSSTSKRFLNIARSQPTSEVNDDIVSKHSLGEMSYSFHLCDANFGKVKLSTSTQICIKVSFCCGEGKVVVPPLDTPPELLTHLLNPMNKRGK